MLRFLRLDWRFLPRKLEIKNRLQNYEKNESTSRATYRISYAKVWMISTNNYCISWKLSVKLWTIFTLWISLGRTFLLPFWTSKSWSHEANFLIWCTCSIKIGMRTVEKYVFRSCKLSWRWCQLQRLVERKWKMQANLHVICVEKAVIKRNSQFHQLIPDFLREVNQHWS